MPIGAQRYSENVLPQRGVQALRVAIDVLTDFIHEDLRNLEEPDATLGDTHHIFDHLPPKYRLKYGRFFLQRFLACATVVGWKLFDVQEHQLACTAEELALKALISVAQAVVEVGDEEPVDFDALEDVAFEDMDFLFLFDMSLDGIENTDTGRYMRMSNLPFDDWFLPFGDRVVHPYGTGHEATEAEDEEDEE